jgi:predicted transcriptional regulator
MPRELTNTTNRLAASYLPADLAVRARTYAKTTRRSLSSVIAEAVAEYFERRDRLAELEQLARKVGV